MEATVKKYITSLLTSTPLVVSIQQLNKDYRNTIGESIPYQKLGYNSLEHFLRCIPDTVMVKGGGPLAQILPVASEKSAHVSQLVSNQKVVRNRKNSCIPRKRMSIIFPPDYNSQPSYKPKPIPPLISNHKIENAPQVPPVQKIENVPQISSKKMYYPAVKDTSVPNRSTHVASTYKKPLDVPPINYESSSTARKDSTSYKPNEMLRKPSDILGSIKHFKKLNENVREGNFSNGLSPATSGGTWTTNAKRIVNDLDRVSVDQLENGVPMQVRNNLKSLISQCPEGIWCAEVPVKYRKLFRQELDYQELGFKSLIHLCVGLSSIFHYVRPSTDDYKLYDRSRPLPDCAEKTYTMASYSSSNKNMAETDSNCALPSLDWADMKKFLPTDIFMPGEEIPRAFVSHEVQENDEIDVVVGEIYDLSKFWVYIENSQLDTLMDSIQEFYRQYAQEYYIPDHLIREGVYCVQVIFGEYHRALIVDTMPELQDTIRVIFIDYGTMTKVSTKGLCFLHIDFSKLEAQAIRCRLANVFPLEEGAPWTREACIAFRRLVVDKDITAKISHINWDEQYLEVYLADVTKKETTYYLNDRLVETGFAQQPDKERTQPLADSVYTPIVKYLHLFPTFLELEHGLAPSTAEMEIFHECKVPVNFLYPQYFYIDQTGEEAVIKAAEEFHENHLFKEKRRTPSSQYFDRDKYAKGELDLSLFGELQHEILAFVRRPTKEDQSFGNYEDFVDVVRKSEPDRVYDCPDVNQLADQLREIHIKEEETVNVLRKDLIVTEDIMKDINKFLKVENSGDSEQCGNSEKKSEFNLVKEEWQQFPLVENSEVTGGVNCTAVKKEPLTPDELMHHPLSTMTFEENRLSDEENISYGHSDDCNYDLRAPDVHLEGIKISLLPEDHPLSIINRLKKESENNIRSFLDDESLFEDVEELPSFTDGEQKNTDRSNTNPFLASPSTDLKIDVTKLNPNNPFLNFLHEDDKSSSGGSSSSTVYEYPAVAASQHSWSSFNDMNAETISLLGRSLRGSSTSSGSMKIVEDRRTCSTQTLEQQTKAVQVVEAQCQYFYPPPHEYPAWAGGYGVNPYYSVRFSNFQGYTLESQRPACPPPPGFRPQGVFPGAGGFGPAHRLPSSPAHGFPSGPAHGLPSGPAHGLPSGPAHGLPSGPAHGLPSGPAHALPSGPAHGLPSGPAHCLPNAPPNMRYGLPRPMCYYPMPRFAPSGAVSTAAGQSSGGGVAGGARDGRDFYEVYNEQLKASHGTQ